LMKVLIMPKWFTFPEAPSSLIPIIIPHFREWHESGGSD
jgi:hypothetical protein